MSLPLRVAGTAYGGHCLTKDGCTYFLIAPGSKLLIYKNVIIFAFQRIRLSELILTLARIAKMFLNEGEV